MKNNIDNGLIPMNIEHLAMKRILVLSPHPDDESIGCGGVLHQHVKSGDQVHTLFLTSGERGGHGMSPELTLQTRESEAQEAAEILGYRSLEFWRVPNGKLTSSASLAKRLTQKVKTFKPDIIYVTHDKEQHPEHRAAARLVRKSLQSIPKSKAPVVLMYEVWTPLQRMDHIVDITSVVEVKRLAIQAHRCQCAVMAFDEAIIGLNRYRGEMFSWPEGDYAEVFEKMRIQ